MTIKAEAERLFGFGFAVHWIRKNSKAPIHSEWSKPVRDPIKEVLAEYRSGYGLGVKLGKASTLKAGGCLANIDVDIKSSSKKHQREALDKLDELFPNLLDTAPLVKTGNGFRLFIRTERPVKSKKLFISGELVKVHLPTTEVTKHQKSYVKEGRISEKELAEGWRIRGAWEIELMSIGRQVLVPPTIHPDTGRPYLWERPLTSPDRIPLLGESELDFDDSSEDSETTQHDGQKDDEAKNAGPFVPVKVDLGNLSREQIAVIKDGEGVTDRSAACLSVAIVMVRAGYSDQEIISVLTDRDYFLGETSYDHRKTKSRTNAANWVRQFCLRKAKAEASAKTIFRHEIAETPLLDSDEEVKAQTEDLAEFRNITSQFVKNKFGRPYPSFENTMTALTHRVGKGIARDLFVEIDRYVMPPPWGWEKGRMAGDRDDTIRVKSWLAETYDFAPAVSTVDEVITEIALSNAFHPIRDELRALDDWDFEYRLDNWLPKYFDAKKDPPKYVGDVFRKLMVASVMRTFQPGYKMDWMPVLEGATGVGKGRFASIIAGPGYHIDDIPSPHIKPVDAALQLEGARIVEFSELSVLKNSSNESIKAFISRCADKIRRPYDKKPITLARQCVFIGTTNEETYLYDQTGNRRYNPIRVGELDEVQLKRDRDQLWAEALWIYDNFGGEILYLDGNSLSYSKKIQEAKMVSTDADAMRESILDFIERDPKGDAFDFNRFPISQLFDGGPLAKWKGDAKNLKAAGIALRKLNATKWPIRGRYFWKLDCHQFFEA